MKILSVTKYKGTTYCLEIENFRNIYVGESTVTKYNLKSGLNLPQQALEEITNSDLERKAKERALYLLAARDYCFVELYKKLEQTYPHEISLSTCKKIAEMGLIDDTEYAKKYARQLFEIKGYGKYRAKQEMKRRGLTESVIEMALEMYSDKEETMQRLETLVERKYERYLTDEKGVKKVKSALARLGYSYEMINAVIGLYDLEFK